jgi:hypothetical protein
MTPPPEKKKKEAPILSNPKYKSDDLPCAGDCLKCMFRSFGCNRRRADTEVVVQEVVVQPEVKNDEVVKND